MFRALILDWSGTLVDDMGPTLTATNAVFAKFDKPPMTWEEFRASFRLPYSEWYDEHVPGVGLQELEEHFRTAFNSSEHAVTPLEGTAEFLEWCSANGIRLFVLTSMNAENFEQQLREFSFGCYFEATYSGVLDKREVIHGILDEHGLNPAETAYVGDMAHDIDTAHHGGVTSVGVLSGYDQRPRLVAAGPHLLLSCIKSLHVLLEKSQDWAACESAASLDPQDHILIKRLAVDCFIGVPEDERAQLQTLYLTLTVVPMHPFASLQDNIDETVDYDAVARRMRAVATERPRRLIETLADDLARIVVEEFNISKVWVEVEKHILPDTDAVSVSTSRRRSWAGGPSNRPAS
jgi:phosphoglycolate phosphatase